MSAELIRNFIPPELAGEEIKIDETLMPIVERIGAYLSPEEIWQYFSSFPSASRGIKQLPYYRVDKSLCTCNDRLLMAKQREAKKRGFCHDYEVASRVAMEILLWTEVGFGGLQNLAASQASRNMTPATGYSLDDKERIDYMKIF